MVARIFAVMSIWAGLAIAAPAAAQEASPQLRDRAEQVVALLNGEADPATLFTPEFLAQVPAEQLRTITAQLRAQHGSARSVERIEPRSETSATIRIAAERAVLTLTLALEAAPPHRIAGLLVTGTEIAGDSLERISREIAALPGSSSFLVARLGGERPQRIAGHREDEPMAIGSTFKLFILGALQRQIAAGERRWDEVVRLDRRSLPSGMLQNWPEGSPVTIHSLAALMISISDNSATDTLLHLVGRENVERFMTDIGIEAAARNRPFLSTLEAFTLKAAPDEAYRAWLTADEAERRRLLAESYGQRSPEGLDPSRFAARPTRIPVEWFASASDLVRVMDWMRREGGDTVRAILSIAPGVPAPSRGDYRYLGYKGGSEGGVLNLTWLVQGGDGAWHVVTGSWNNPEASLDEARFAGLMRRALQMVR